MKKFLQQKPLSTFDERLKKTPKDNPLRGYWTEKRGLSTYIPTSSQTEILEILHHYNLKGIRYTEAMPIFEKCSECTIQSNNMSILRWKNQNKCDNLCAILWNAINYQNKSNWTKKDVKAFRKLHSLSWHERNDRITYDLIPTKINGFFLHLGGIAECKRAKKLQLTTF